MTDINLTRVDSVATISLDGPNDGNMLSVENLRKLASTIRQAGTTDVKVIALTGMGPDFCRGRAPGAASPTAMKMRANVCEPILDVYDAIGGVRQPIVAIVHGRAHGFGAALAGASDITIAFESARFRLPEMEKDLPPTLAISALMPRVHRKALTYMVYSMEEIDAQTALQIGLVSKVVRSDEISVALERLIATMTARSPEALNAVKDYFRVAPYMEPRGAADYGANLLAAVLSSAGK